ncbi:MAG TPA: hypothetical protein PLO16_05875 [Acidocella sp.]|nr:hypothetical protein [Acidocella sp.]
MARFEELTGQPVKPNDFAAVVNSAIAAGDIYNPMKIAPGAIQCQWHCQMAPIDAQKVNEPVQKYPTPFDELTSGITTSGEMEDSAR